MVTERPLDSANRSATKRDWSRSSIIKRYKARRLNLLVRGVAEADGNRTRQRPYRPLTGFEDRGTHQASRRLRLREVRWGSPFSFFGPSSANPPPSSDDSDQFLFFGELVAGICTLHQERMPERTFGRTVRYRRTKLGLSQAKLGELVGRSPSTIRSWERDKSSPSEASVLHTLAAILGVDERILFERAGQEQPTQYEASPTVEEALASLQSVEVSDSPQSSNDSGDPESHPGDDNEAGDVEKLFESEKQQDQQPEPESQRSGDPRSIGTTSDSQAGYVKPPEPYVVTTTTPPLVEPSYMEDPSQRQLYRVRNLATLVVVVALVIALIWALSESLGALGSWWDDFFGSLRF